MIVVRLINLVPVAKNNSKSANNTKDAVQLNVDLPFIKLFKYYKFIIIMNRKDFLNLLEKNNSTLIVFFTSMDCKPCSEIKPYIHKKITEIGHPYLLLDRTKHSDIFAALLSKKQLKGVPSLLAYVKNNVSFIANLSISGTNESEIDYFFDKLDFL